MIYPWAVRNHRVSCRELYPRLDTGVSSVEYSATFNLAKISASALRGLLWADAIGRRPRYANAKLLKIPLHLIVPIECSVESLVECSVDVIVVYRGPRSAQKTMYLSGATRGEFNN
ncbi:hypothetical protein [Moorena sp. SIO4G3]|uniref:hypothetical protein n=1 Tax=Moorena sp. SIO4G3 TaxID=2607821 RepID=UPI00142A0E92|nr:hypothetical protein [Moorena sp. SIO4G3]NEO75703.1 hypothetical protein [Moorena sp. SIO4G3]